MLSVEDINHINEVIIMIEESGFDIEKEFDDFTISSIMNDTEVNNNTRKENIPCLFSKCKNKALRNNICRRHLLLKKENRCSIEKCLNLKSISLTTKQKKYNDLCVKHKKSKRLLAKHNLMDLS